MLKLRQIVLINLEEFEDIELKEVQYRKFLLCFFFFYDGLITNCFLGVVSCRL